jgi:transposase
MVIGLDLAKKVFEVNGADARGQAVVRQQLKRKDMAKYFERLPPCLIGMEACGGARESAAWPQQGNGGAGQQDRTPGVGAVE